MKVRGRVAPPLKEISRLGVAARPMQPVEVVEQPNPRVIAGIHQDYTLLAKEAKETRLHRILAARVEADGPEHAEHI